jgi:predicted MFS family arabinose efflux permease
MDRRLLPLAFAVFAVGTDGFVIAGLLPAIGSDLGISTAAAGQLITVFAIAYALALPILGALTGDVDRRRVMLAGLVVFIAGNVATALATDFGFAVAARVLTALGGALITPQASAVAAAIAPPERRGRYLAVVMGGFTAATALGVPLGTLIGAGDWRFTLWAIVGLSLLASAGIAIWLPALHLPAVGFAERLAPLKDRAIIGIIATTGLILASGYVLYTYLGTAMAEATGGSQALLTLVLLAQGVGSVVGNLVAGRLVDRFGPERLLLGAQVGYTILLALSPLAITNLAVAIPYALIFGTVGWATIVPQQHRLVTRHPNAATILIGLNGSALYAGIAVGGLVGGLSLNWVPTSALGFVGAAIGVVGIAVTLSVLRAKAASPAPLPVPAEA